MTSLKWVFQKPHMPKLENFPARFPKKKKNREKKVGKEETTLKYSVYIFSLFCCCIELLKVYVHNR